jgi:signal transduction histidine kinase
MPWIRLRPPRLSVLQARCQPYVFGAVSSLVALGLALALAPEFNDAPVPLFLAAVLVSAWVCGLAAGLVTTGLSALALATQFDLSRASPLPGPADTAFDLVLFCAVASLISWLTTRLQDANRRLDAARAEAEAAVRTREEFLATAAHDLMSPLTGISMIAQHARRRLERMDADKPVANSVSLQLAEIEATARRIAGVLDELLDLAHFDAGRPIQLNLKSISLLDMVETAVALHQARTDAHTLRVVVGADPVGLWDPSRVARVVDNLLSNAIKYSPAGGEIVVEVAEECRTDGVCRAVLRVRDPGVGIPAADVGRVFERYYRAANVGSIGGMGIGLAGARQITEQHGGTLTVESREGSGSTFSLRLPL